MGMTLHTRIRYAQRMRVEVSRVSNCPWTKFSNSSPPLIFSLSFDFRPLKTSNVIVIIIKFSDVLPCTALLHHEIERVFKLVLPVLAMTLKEVVIINHVLVLPKV